MRRARVEGPAVAFDFAGAMSEIQMFKSMDSGGGIKAQQRMMSQMHGRQKFGR
jgi:hypothetical protein